MSRIRTLLAGAWRRTNAGRIIEALTKPAPEPKRSKFDDAVGCIVGLAVAGFAFYWMVVALESAADATIPDSVKAWFGDHGSTIAWLLAASFVFFCFAQAIDAVHKDVRSVKDDLRTIRKHLGIREDWER